MRGFAPLAFFTLALLACESPPDATAPPPPLSSSPAAASASLPTTAPWPTPPAYDLAADLALRRALAVADRHEEDLISRLHEPEEPRLLVGELDDLLHVERRRLQARQIARGTSRRSASWA